MHQRVRSLPLPWLEAPSTEPAAIAAEARAALAVLEPGEQVDDVLVIAFTPAAIAGYFAGRLRRIASQLLTAGINDSAEALQDMAEQLEHDFSLPPPGHGAA